MTDWIYQKKAITCLEDLPDCYNLFGFIYKITSIHTGKFYIGKKVLKFTRKKKITKTEKKQTKTRKRFQYVSKESDWLDYYGSCKELQDDIKLYGKTCFKREIIELCYHKKYLNYSELKWQINLDVLTSYTYNGNILGRYYPKDLINKKNDRTTQHNNGKKANRA